MRSVGIFIFWICWTAFNPFSESQGAELPAETPKENAFLVISPDRGYRGNQEIETLFHEFSPPYPARLLFVSLSEEYDPAIREALDRAIEELKGAGARRLILLPLVLSKEDPHLKKIVRFIRPGQGRDRSGLEWIVAPPMSEDGRIAQILEDRAMSLSKDPSQERLILVGYGATNEAEEADLRSSLAGLIREVESRLPFKEREIIVLYHPAASEERWKQADLSAKTALQEIAAKKDLRNIVIPFHLGFKHTDSMQLNRGIESMVEGPSFHYNGVALFPHPNLIRWLRRTANRFQRPAPEEIGVVVMAHGAGHYYNQKILKAVSPLKEKYRVEVAFGMADTDTLQEAIESLESRGAKAIHVVRLYDTAASLQEATEYVLNLRGEPAGHGHAGAAPERVRSGALFSTSGGLEDHPLISQVLLERVLEVSREPEKETVILLAHGAASDEKDLLWKKKMESRAQFIKDKSGKAFKAIQVATLREDWPEKREKAVREIRKMIEEANQNGGKAIVISNRIVGAGPYQKYLKGLDYLFNGTGIAPHPNLTRWIEQEIEKGAESLLKGEGRFQGADAR